MVSNPDLRESQASITKTVSRKTWFHQKIGKIRNPRWMHPVANNSAVAEEERNRSNVGSSTPGGNGVLLPTQYKKTGLQSTVWLSEGQQDDDGQDDAFVIESPKRQNGPVQLLNTSVRKRARKISNDQKASTPTSRELEAASRILSSTTRRFERPVAMFYTAADYYTSEGELKNPNPSLPLSAFLPRHFQVEQNGPRPSPAPSVQEQVPRKCSKQRRRRREEVLVSLHEQHMQQMQQLQSSHEIERNWQIQHMQNIQNLQESDQKYLLHQQLHLQQRQSQDMYQQRLVKWKQERDLAPRTKSKYDTSEFGPPKLWPRFMSRPSLPSVSQLLLPTVLQSSTPPMSQFGPPSIPQPGPPSIPQYSTPLMSQPRLPSTSQLSTPSTSRHSINRMPQHGLPSMPHRSMSHRSQPRSLSMPKGSTPAAQPPATPAFQTMASLAHDHLQQSREIQAARCAKNHSNN